MSILSNRNVGIGLSAMLGGFLYGYFGKAYLADIPLVTAQSSLYTQILAWGMGICGLVTCLEGILEVRRGTEIRKKNSFAPDERKRLALFIVITAVTLLAMPYLGFMVSAVLAAMSYMYLMHERRWKHLAAVSILFCLALYLLFGVALGVNFTQSPLSRLFM